MTCGSRTTAAVKAIALVAICVTAEIAAGAPQAPAARTIAAKLAASEIDSLGHLACGAPPQTVSAIRYLDPPFGTDAEVHCESHGEYLGHVVSRSVQCRLGRNAQLWSCGTPTPTIETRAPDGRALRILYSQASAAEALQVIAFLLDAPIYRDMRVKPEWITSGARVNRDGNHVYVGTDRHQFSLARDDSAGITAYRINEIMLCVTDTCHPIELVQAKP